MIISVGVELGRLVLNRFFLPGLLLPETWLRSGLRIFRGQRLTLRRFASVQRGPEWLIAVPSVENMAGIIAHPTIPHTLQFFKSWRVGVCWERRSPGILRLSSVPRSWILQAS
ncbi:MAG: hypothetical protein WAK06_04355 [Glutamicibacter protophormiae]